MLMGNFPQLVVEAILFAESDPYFINVLPPTSMDYFSQN